MTAKTEQGNAAWLSTDYVFACIDDPNNATKAAEALRTAGFHTQDLHLLSGTEFVNSTEEECEQCDILTRFIRLVWKWGIEEGITFEYYKDQAKAGHTIVIVHVLKPDSISEVQRILSEHQAHKMEYWSRYDTHPLQPV